MQKKLFCAEKATNKQNASYMYLYAHYTYEIRNVVYNGIVTQGRQFQYVSSAFVILLLTESFSLDKRLMSASYLVQMKDNRTTKSFE